MRRLIEYTAASVLCSAVLLLPVFPQDGGRAQDDAQPDGTEKTNETVLPHVYTYIDTPVAEQRQVYTCDDIEKLHVKSLAELFNSAGIQTIDYGSYGSQTNPSIRGFTGGTVKVVIDGVPVNSAQNGNFDFTSFNPSDIEKIEITRGGFTEGLSGEGAVGGVIYITTKSQQLGNHFTSGISAKSYFNNKYPADTVYSNFGWDGQTGENTFVKMNLNGTYAANHFFYYNNTNKIRERENAEVKDGSADVKVSHYFGNGSSWTFGDIFYGGYKNIPNTSGIQQDYNNNLSASLSMPEICEGVSFNAASSWLSNNEWYDDAGESSIHHLTTGVLQGEASLHKYEKVKQTAGVSLKFDYLDSTNSGTHLLVSGTVKETTKLKISKILSCSVPLSFIFSGNNCAVVPKAGLCADFSSVKFLLDGYRLAAFPTMNQLYWKGAGAAGNGNLGKEEGWGAEFSCSMPACFIPFTASLYTDYYEKSIHWGYKDGVWTPLNLKSAFYLGCDVSAEKSFAGVFVVSGSFEYLYNRLLDKSDTATYGKMIMWTPDIVASCSAQLFLKYFHFIIEGIYTGKRYEDNTNYYALDPYFIVNAAADFTVWNHITPYIRSDNLFDKTYESVPGYPMPGISVTCGIKAKW